MKILVTGSRGRDSEADMEQLACYLDSLDYNRKEGLIVVHGDCPKSPDKLAQRYVRHSDWATERAYPADWETHGRQAGYIRNAVMLSEEKPDLVVAQWDGESKGTLNTIQVAVSKGIEVMILPPIIK